MFDPKSYEQKIVQYWRDTNVRDKWRDATKNGKKFYFLQGPPYTSGRVHLGTAWNNCVKDSVLRFKRMTGHNVWDRAGYDMHGLPTEQKVLKLHDLRLMSDIKAFGEEKFSEECLTFSTEQMRQMDIDFESFGISLDFSDSYQPVKTDYMEGVWQLIKKAHDTKRLYKGLRTMGWSAYFQTALAKHEMVYKTVTDTSIFVKFKLKGTKNEYLVIWTTTPWTIPFNLAIMVNPQAEYVKAKVISCGDSGGTITNLESGTYTGEFTLFYNTGGSQLTNTATFNIRVSP